MLRTIGYSVLTQLVASGGNFLTSVLILRFVSLEAFGVYAYLWVFIGFGAVISGSLGGSVYHILKPRSKAFAYAYERLYCGFSLLTTAAVILVAVALASVTTLEFPLSASSSAIAAMIAGTLAADALKLQAAADGRHALVFRVELVRQAAAVLLILLLGWRKGGLDAILLAHGFTGLAATATLMVGIGWRPSFRRMGWIVRRHWQHARYLVPSGIIAAFHGGVVLMLAAQRFGPEAVGLLRTAELPFSAINPLRSSLQLFLPGAIDAVERERRPGTRRQLLLRGAVMAAALAAGCLAIWALSIPLLPLLTHKDYPAALGLAFAAAYINFFIMQAANIYLVVVDRAEIVFRQSVLGAVATTGLYLLLAPLYGYAAAGLAIAGGAVAMAAYALAKLVRHLRAKSG